ncbi:MAG: hypothetical protein WAO00_08705, partial [Chthoniobacterales bacterium]
VETACSRLLETRICPTIPEKFLNALDFSGGRHSKLALLRMLELVEPTDVKFVRGLSKIRNRLVHNITHVGFSIDRYVAGLASDEARQFAAETCAVFLPESLPAGEWRDQYAAILREPKDFVWRSALMFLALTSMQIDLEKLEARLAVMDRENLERDAAKSRQVATDLGAAFWSEPGRNVALGIYQDFVKKHGARSENLPPESPPG